MHGKHSHSHSHLADSTLTRELHAAVATESSSTAMVVGYIAEFDARRLYQPAGYSSMFAYAVGELGLSEDAAYKRIQAARAARRFRALFELLGEGELHLAAVVLLAPHLTESNARELIAAARRRTKTQIEELLAAHFPKPELPEMVRAIPAPGLHQNSQLAPGQVESCKSLSELAPNLASEPIPSPAPMPERASELDDASIARPVPQDEPRARTMPVSADRFALQLTMDCSTHDKLRRAQDLLGHQMRSGDLAGLFDRALDALIRELEKRKFAACSQPRAQRRRQARARASNPRRIPAEVKRSVWERDGGQCTFVSANGHRCGCRRRLQFDHIVPIARGGKSEVPNLRVRCSAHNQYEAELVFGAGFMERKREQARDRVAEARARVGRHSEVDIAALPGAS